MTTLPRAPARWGFQTRRRKGPAGESALKVHLPRNVRLRNVILAFVSILLSFSSFRHRKKQRKVLVCSLTQHREGLTDEKRFPIAAHLQVAICFAATASLVLLSKDYAIRSVLSEPASLYLGPWSRIIGFLANDL
ncbi:hypothetical protein CGRA01v4_14600 [Colletotrichum graminicola]|nr:hypothetical protein CGRA01v4_14600 [Colletotrichum graminicola]